MRTLITLFVAFVAIPAMHASEPFNGRLVDINGKPKKGVKVYVNNPRHYVKSDKEGEFELADVKSTDTLHAVVNEMVYDIPVNKSRGMRIIVINDIATTGNEEQEEINIGTGSMKKRDYLGPHSGVTHEQLVATGETDLIKAMRGLVPGVQVVGENLSIRNSMSVNAPSDPLWVIDGSESTIAPSLTVMEVEKVEILKDGAGYGTRGANGVIIVTLK